MAKRKELATNLVGRRVQPVHPAHDREAWRFHAARQELKDQDAYVARQMEGAPTWNELPGEVVAVHVDDEGCLMATVALDEGRNVGVLVEWCRLLAAPPQPDPAADLAKAIRYVGDQVANLKDLLCECDGASWSARLIANAIDGQEAN